MDDVLVLNTTMEPLNVVELQRAIQLLLRNKAKIVHVRNRDVRTVSFAIPLPSVIQMLYFIKRGRQSVALSKKNVLLRDKHQCMYCGVVGEQKLTVDHVFPKSRGGPSTFENLVCACVPCNTRKRDRTPEEAGMKLRRKPYRPRYIAWAVFKRHTAPEEWALYASLWSVSIEERLGQ